jgi:hypothetical protein
MAKITTQTTATGLTSLELSDAIVDGTNDSVLKIAATMNCLALNTDPSPVSAAARQGIIGVSATRQAGYEFTTWDGNPDCGMKMVITNASANGSNGAVRGLDLQARNRGSVAACGTLEGAYITSENNNAVANTITTSTVAQLNMKNNGVATNNWGLIVQDQSQGTSTNAALVRLTTGTINPASGAVDSAINIASKNTAGITNLINAESATLDCAVVGGAMGAVAGYFKVKVNGVSYKIPFNAVA